MRTPGVFPRQLVMISPSSLMCGISSSRSKHKHTYIVTAFLYNNQHIHNLHVNFCHMICDRGGSGDPAGPLRFGQSTFCKNTKGLLTVKNYFLHVTENQNQVGFLSLHTYIRM